MQRTPKRLSPQCVRDRFDDCMCRRCDPMLYDLADAAESLARWRDANDPKPLAEAIDTVLSLVPGRVERRRWAVRALTVIRAKGIEPAIVDGALRVPMEQLPAALREWLADPDSRAAVEDLLDEEATGERQEAA